MQLNGLPLVKKRAKLRNFGEMEGNCVKKAVILMGIGREKGRERRNILRKVLFWAKKHFVILAVFGAKHFAKNAMLYTKDYQKDEIVTCLPVYYAILV